MPKWEMTEKVVTALLKTPGDFTTDSAAEKHGFKAGTVKGVAATMVRAGALRKTKVPNQRSLLYTVDQSWVRQHREPVSALLRFFENRYQERQGLLGKLTAQYPDLAKTVEGRVLLLLHTNEQRGKTPERIVRLLQLPYDEVERAITFLELHRLAETVKARGRPRMVRRVLRSVAESARALRELPPSAWENRVPAAPAAHSGTASTANGHQADQLKHRLLERAKLLHYDELCRQFGLDPNHPPLEYRRRALEK